VVNEFIVTADSCLVGPLVLGRQQGLTLNLPDCPDKSLTHRAIMLASMARGHSSIFTPLASGDCLATRAAFTKLGVRFTEEKDASQRLIWRVNSPGMSRWQSPATPIDLGNSGTSARLLTGLFAGVAGLKVTITGDASLQRRPMARVIQPLRSMGAEIVSTGGGGDGETLPLTITGKVLTARHHHLKTPSAQVTSALILAGLSCQGQSVIEKPIGGRDHTEVILNFMGASLDRSNDLGLETIRLNGPWIPEPFACQIPSDPSSVAFFAALAALHPGLTVTVNRLLISKTRTGFFRVLERMGVTVFVTKDQFLGQQLGEATASYSFYLSPGQALKPVNVHQNEVQALIDEVPILAVVASFAEGISKIQGLTELKVKESDRLSATHELLALAGVPCEVHVDALEVRGVRRVSAFSFGSQDHRMVMAAMVLASKGDNKSNISGLDWIGTSFPAFVRLFENLYSFMGSE
jgi:3-phosphoshikimate 1-carboxyvinyltransferase